METEHGTHEGAPLFAVSAAFGTPGALVEAVRSLRPRNLGRLEAFSPVPIAGLAQALGLHGRGVRPFAVAGGLVGLATTWAIGLYAMRFAYVFDIAGRPAFDWQPLVIPGLASLVVGGALASVGAMLTLNRLPRLNHHAFNIPDFARASEDRFFLAVECRDDSFDLDAVEQALQDLPHKPLAVARVKR